MSVKPAQVLCIDKVAEDVFHLSLKLLWGAESVRPFNFFTIWVPRVDEIPLSIAYYDGEKYSFLFKVRGVGTKALASIRPGSFLGLKGPLGRGFLIHDKTSRILAVVGGIGIAPIPFFIKGSSYSRLDVVWGVKKKSELFDLNKLFPEIAGKYHLITATEDCSYGVCGTVIDALKNIDLDTYDIIIAVGPQPMLRLLCENTRELKASSVYVALETIVKCGAGLCGSCYIKYTNKLLCVDGPVFRCDEVIVHLRESADS